jgi:glycerophosphoryl diester phosphodiesterase
MPPSDYPRIIAHRCGGRLAAENTLAGLHAAARLGCRGVEFDVMLSADDIPVLMHDETVDRTTDGSGRVAELTLTELLRLNAGGEPVPTLEQALATCQRLGLWANVEIKPSAGLEARTGEVAGRLLSARWQGPGVVSSFSLAAIRAARRVAPELRYALLAETLPPDWQVLTRELELTGWHLPATAAAEVRALSNTGLNVACYTVDAPDLAAALFAAGATAIFSDRPDHWSAADL